MGNPPQKISDIFIIYIICSEIDDYIDFFGAEVENARGLYQEFQRNKSSIESYRLVMLGLVLYKIKDLTKAVEVLMELISRQDPTTGEIKKAETSITRSSGLSLSVETTSLVLLLIIWLEKFNLAEAIDRCMKFLTSNLKNGAFSSTQATILSLKAISEYMKAFKSAGDQSLSFGVTLNGAKVGSLAISPSSLQSQCLDISDKLAAVEQSSKNLVVTVNPDKKITEKGKYLISIDFVYFDKLPLSAPNSPLKVSYKTNAAQNQITYEFTIRNLRNEDHGMMTFEYVKPSCLDVNINDLDNMLLRNQINKYEFRENNSVIVFYWRGIAKNSSVNFAFSASRRYTSFSSCVERASVLYLYYNKEESTQYFVPK